MNAVITFLSWCLLALVATMRFSVKPTLSASERDRLVAQGDKHAVEEEKQLERVSLFESFRFIIRTLLVSAFITYCVVAYGIVYGVILGTVLVLLVPLAFRVPLICKLADTLRDRSLPWLIRVVEFARPVLAWLRERDIATGDNVLNSQAELLDLVHRSPGILSRDEQQRLVANLAFDDRKVADVMTPRSMIKGVSVKETLGPLVLDELYKTGHSRFPVYDKDIDHVVGMLYLHDLLDLKQGSKPAKEAMQSKVYFIREDKALSHALHGFLSTHHHLFVVVNQYRETVGLLSLEDVMEALLGMKIQDEFDAFDDLRAVAEHNPYKNNDPRSREDI